MDEDDTSEVASTTSTVTSGSTVALDGSSTGGIGTSEGGASTSGGLADGSSSTGAAVGPITYCVDIDSGGYDRLDIWKRDELANVCVVVRLVRYNHDWDGPTLDVPADYFTERIEMEEGLADCGVLPLFQDREPIAAVGVVEMVGEPLAFVPDFVGIDATLTFEPVEPWIPAQVLMQAEGLEVWGSCVIDGVWVSGQ